MECIQLNKCFNSLKEIDLECSMINNCVKPDFLGNITDNLSQNLTSLNHSVNNFWSGSFYLFFLPLIFTLLLILFLKFMPNIKKFIKKKQADFGRVEVWFLMNNKRIKERMIKIDEFNNFQFKGGRYSMEKMSHFIIGYRNNIPVFFYDKNFILPLIIEKHKINDEIKKQYAKAGIKLTDTDISGIGVKLEPTILDLVYKKKLISDLYSIVKDDGMNKVVIWALIILGVFLALYYTGMLEPILQTIGINISKPINTTIVNATTR
jgi:hypothetical protein